MRGFTFQTSESKQALYAALLCMCAAATGLAASEGFSSPPFGHYQPILDRMPFGALPANFNASSVDPAAAKNEEQVKADQQKLAKQINMSAVNVTPDGGTAIGFTDLSEKPPINYYLLVGAEAGGWKVLSADYDEETALIEKEGISITLKLGKGLVDTAPQPGKPVSSVIAGVPTGGLHRAAPGGRPDALVPRSSAVPPPGAPDKAGGSYRDRLLNRKQQEIMEVQVAAKKQQEQLENLAREAAQKEIKKREEEAAQSEAEANNPAPDDPPPDAALPGVQ